MTIFGTADAEHNKGENNIMMWFYWYSSSVDPVFTIGLGASSSGQLLSWPMVTKIGSMMHYSVKNVFITNVR